MITAHFDIGQIVTAIVGGLCLVGITELRWVLRRLIIKAETQGQQIARIEGALKIQPDVEQ